MYTSKPNLIHIRIEHQVNQTPNANAVIFQNQQLTYAELNQKANQLAHYLKGLGVGPEVLVGICIERSLDMIIALLGILKAGGAYVPLDPTYPVDRLSHIIEDAHFPVVLTQNKLTHLFCNLEADIVELDSDWPKIAAQSITNPVQDTQPTNLAYVIYTSGSTGKPKGVALEHRNTIAFINWAQECYSTEQLQGVLASTSICFDLSIFEIFVTLCSGGLIILAQNALELPTLPAANQVKLLNTVPSAAATLLRTHGLPESIKIINLAGEPLKNSLAQQLYQLPHVEQVYNLYGPTEDTTYSTYTCVEKGSSTEPTIGRPITNTQAYLIHYPARRKGDPIQLVPEGEIGELCLSGEGLARGYLNHEQLTSEKFIPNPFSSETGSRLYRTGDLAIKLPNGDLKYLGRLDHQVKIRGFRIEIGDIETALHQHPLVEDAVILARNDVGEHQRLIAYVVPSLKDAGEHPAELKHQFNTEQLKHWQVLWNTTYGAASDQNEILLDSTGWIDSFTNLPMPEDEVQEWVTASADRILALKPRRVLEIGCGRGLLLSRIAPTCEHYFGLDISAEAIRHIEQQLQKDSKWSHVQVCQGTAHELEQFKPQSFDTIILNSVIQYFPSVEYLVKVLEKATHLVQPGGQIFVGDIRDLELLELFHTGVQLNRADDALPISQLRQLIKSQIYQDKELVLHPDFFTALKYHIPRISHVQTQLKRGFSRDELTRLRLDIILHVEANLQSIAEPSQWDWQLNPLTLPQIKQLLRNSQPESLKITGIPNQRMCVEAAAVTLIQSNQFQTAGSLRQAIQGIETGLHPENLWALSQEFPYHVYITRSQSHAATTYDVILQHQSIVERMGEQWVLPEKAFTFKTWQTYANTPLQSSEKSFFIQQIRTFLKDRLPDYMIPSAFVILNEFPLNLNGKIDRRALPNPKKERPTLTEDYLAPQSKLEQDIASIWSQVLEIETIGIRDSFFDLGGNSLSATQVLSQIEDLTHVKVPLLYFLKQPTIEGIVSVICSIQVGGYTVPILEEIPADLERDRILDLTIQVTSPFVELQDEPKHILLTGATGFLGAFLLSELLLQTPAKIYCFIRAASLEEAWQKIRGNLNRYQLNLGDLMARVHPILGDLTQPLLGLQPQQFEALGYQLDAIYHSAALVNLVCSYSTLRNANILGTQEILRLAAQGKTKPVHFISTIDVLKPLTISALQKISEEAYQDEGAAVDKGYTQTKWAAEQLILAARLRGIPACIFRPGMITGHSQTGASNTNDLMCRIIKGIIQLKAAPCFNHCVNMTPVDYASKAIVYLSRQSEALNQAFHIINPHSLHWLSLIQEISSFGYPIDLMAHETWKSKLLNLPRTSDHVLDPMKFLFTELSNHQFTYFESFLKTSQSFSCQKTVTLLKKAEIVCPPVDAQILRQYFNFFLESGFLQSGVETSLRSVLKYVPV